MNRRSIALAAVAVLLIGSAAAVQAQESSGIHVRVNEAEGAMINVNLPMSLVEVAMEIAQDHIFDEDHGSISVAITTWSSPICGVCGRSFAWRATPSTSAGTTTMSTSVSIVRATPTSTSGSTTNRRVRRPW